MTAHNIERGRLWAVYRPKGVKSMLRIEQTYLIDASPEEVWEALTNPELMAQWSGQRAEYAANVGSPYKLFDDYVVGEIVEADAPSRLTQTWKPNDWTVEDSIVSFTLTPVEGGTRVDLVHENVDPGDYEGTNKGWDEFYVGALKKMLEADDEMAEPAPKPAKKAAPKKAPAKKKIVAKKSAAKKPVAKKAAAKKTVTKKKPAAKKKATTRSRAR
jgi:uncharacterized protein YndB with AHSA1/START domain